MAKAGEEKAASNVKKNRNTPHVLLFPLPIQGHMPPLLKLSHLLISYTSNLYITFLNTEYSHRRFALHSPSLSDHLDRDRSRSRFRFRTIPDGLSGDDERQFQNFLGLEQSLRTRSREHYRKVLLGEDPEDEEDGWPPVSLVLVDAIVTVGIDVADELGIPVMVFRTSSACAFWVYRSLRTLVHRGDIPFPENADLDEKIQGIEGMENMRRRDLPSLCRYAKSPNDPGLRILTAATNNASRGRALIINTFESLEAPMLSLLRSFCPIVYSVGPVHLFAKTKNQANLWQEDQDCMTWLDTQPPKSVVYVSFGSIAVMSREELVELWHGLINSGHRFLWVIRQDLVLGENLKAPTPELEAATKERGCIVSWAPQEKVLAHPAVGCFLTHSGWNSTMESIVAGVPMICFPFITDQQVNSRFVSEVWRLGLDMKDKCGRDVVERMVREVMEGEKAEEVRRTAGEMAAKARESVEEGGSSYLNLQMLIEHIKSLSLKQSNEPTSACSVIVD